MTADDGFLDLEEEHAAEEMTDFVAARNELKRRCTEAKIPYEEIEDDDGDVYATILLPAGREKRPIHFFNTKRINDVLALPFERYTFLGDYVALCSYEDRVIIAAVRFLRPNSIATFYRRVLGKPYGEVKRTSDGLLEITHPTDSNQLKITLGRMSDEVMPLLPLQYRSGRGIFLKIEGIQGSQHDQTIELLERLSNSIFFQIDLAFDLPINLIRDRRTPGRTGRGIGSPDPTEIRFPQNEYDEAPISLYWYARSAIGMPLLQFLAYYQSIEFYFPIYSQAEARRKIRNILKNPNFRRERDADLGRILSVARGGGAFGVGDERSQLRATIQECLDPDLLRDFLTSNTKRKEFFSSKTKGLTENKIPINNPNADLRNDVADRIYNLRCKIVHTKVGSQEGEIELLLPFSKEAELLYFDIDLIQYIAQHILIAASSPIRI